MIISPPFLQVGAGSRVDLTAAMLGDMPGKGAFPISYDLAWHGGIHLTSPADDQGTLPVRAIADGVIKYAGKPDTNIDEHNPLYYHAGETSNGVVVIEHKTEIGEDAEVTFYSIYMHLVDLPENITTGKKIYRKDVLGNGGYIYGEPNRIHLEIICDNDNLKKLIGRNSGKLNIAADGRTDALWGEMYFSIPAGTAIFDACVISRKDDEKAAREKAKEADALAVKARKALRAAPRDEELKAAAAQANANAAAAHQVVKEAQNLITQPSNQIATIDSPIFVGMLYDKGACTFTTYTEDGDILGSRTDAGYEYKLYDKSCELYPQCPSAGFELLRFGRVIGPDALKPSDAQHWRKIFYSNGNEGWIDLRPDAIKKFSDADFPHWKHWLLVDDDTNGDSRCDSATIKKLLNPDYDASTTVLQMQGALLMEDIHKKLQRTICKMPSTWSDQYIDQRWSWVKSENEAEKSANLQAAITDENYERLKAHIAALTFWGKTGLPDVEYWHFNPREFIGALRDCGWLSLSEMTQMFPMKAMRKDKTKGWISERVTPKADIIQSNRVELNKAKRKFNIMIPDRMSCFYGNAMQETAWFSTLSEYYPQKTRYYPWHGRGFFQLTWSDNAIKYWEFCGRKIPEQLKKELSSAQKEAERLHKSGQDVKSAANPNPTPITVLHDENIPAMTDEIIDWRDDLENKSRDAAMTAGAYWSWTGAAAFADQSSNNVYVTKDNNEQLAYYTNASFTKVAATINTGRAQANATSVNGLEPRFNAYISSLYTLAETPKFPNSQGEMKLTPENFQPRR